jgi:hypothetical protein
MTPTTQPSDYTNHPFYIVQKCWFDGPHIEPPVDYLRLFVERSEAEAIALQSAHAYAHSKNAVVRTILLPASTQRGSAYAFSAAGKLFWVRQIIAMVQPTTSPMHNSNNNNVPPAHAVVTAGVIGGTGNPSSRRGSEVAQGRVFVGSSSSQWALQVAQSLRTSNTYVTWIPLQAHSAWIQGWPDQQSNAHTTQEPMELHDTSKRIGEWDLRPAKRHCMPRMGSHPPEAISSEVRQFMSM